MTLHSLTHKFSLDYRITVIRLDFLKAVKGVCIGNGSNYLNKCAPSFALWKVTRRGEFLVSLTPNISVRYTNLSRQLDICNKL